MMILTPPSPGSLAVIVPVHNEAGSIQSLIAEIHTAAQSAITNNLILDYEIIYVDDGSTDQTPILLRDTSRQDPHLRVIRHRACCGQTAALWTGIRNTQKEWIITLDGDGQNDPADIPTLIAAYPTGSFSFPPLVSGVRSQRQDSWIRRLSSRLANAIRRRLLDDQTLDSGCSLKLFPRAAFLALPHFDHMHRFIPALFRRYGAPIKLCKVNHRARLHDVSKYGLFDRLTVSILDLIGLYWLKKRTCLPVIEYEE